MKCIIYRCSRKEEMYLYLPYNKDETVLMQGLPEKLKLLTGQLQKVMELELAPERKLARANVPEVIRSLHEKGFYIQMPPGDILLKDKGILADNSDTF